MGKRRLRVDLSSLSEVTWWVLGLAAGLLLFECFFDLGDYVLEVGELPKKEVARRVLLFLSFEGFIVLILAELRSRVRQRKHQRDQLKAEGDRWEAYAAERTQAARHHEDRVKRIVTEDFRNMIQEWGLQPVSMRDFKGALADVDDQKRDIVNDFIGKHADRAWCSGGVWCKCAYQEYFQLLQRLSSDLDAAHAARWISLYPPSQFFGPRRSHVPIHLKAFNESRMSIKDRIVVMQNAAEVLQNLSLRGAYRDWKAANEHVFCVYILAENIERRFALLCKDDFATFDDDVLLKFNDFKEDAQERGLLEISCDPRAVRPYRGLFDDVRAVAAECGGGRFYATLEYLAYDLKERGDVTEHDWGSEWAGVLATYDDKATCKQMEQMVWESVK